jgi:hypothetical protein
LVLAKQVDLYGIGRGRAELMLLVANMLLLNVVVDMVW